MVLFALFYAKIETKFCHILLMLDFSMTIMTGLVSVKMLQAYIIVDKNPLKEQMLTNHQIETVSF